MHVGAVLVQPFVPPETSCAAHAIVAVGLGSSAEAHVSALLCAPALATLASALTTPSAGPSAPGTVATSAQCSGVIS